MCHVVKVQEQGPGKVAGQGGAAAHEVARAVEKWCQRQSRSWGSRRWGRTFGKNKIWSHITSLSDHDYTCVMGLIGKWGCGWGCGGGNRRE